MMACFCCWVLFFGLVTLLDVASSWRQMVRSSDRMDMYFKGRSTSILLAIEKERMMEDRPLRGERRPKRNRKDEEDESANTVEGKELAKAGNKQARFLQGTAREHILKEQMIQKSMLGSLYTSSPNNLRIIAGSAKGLRISSPEVYLRPMMAKVREALFSSLTSFGLFDSSSARVLDLFSGAGSVGLEALSRGAAAATFVDLSPNCIDTCLQNAQALGFQSKVQGVVSRAEEFLRSPPPSLGPFEPFQLVTLTPPYLEVSYTELVQALCVSPLLTENSLVVVEYPIEMGSLPFFLSCHTSLPDTRGGNLKLLKKQKINRGLGDEENAVLYGLRNRRYGRTVLALYVHKPSLSFDLRPDEFMDL